MLPSALCAEHLGFEPVDAYDFWATGFEGGPLQISADGGRTMLALFEASKGHPMVPQQIGVAFSVDADSFMSFARSLPCGIDNPRGSVSCSPISWSWPGFVDTGFQAAECCS